MTPGGASPPAGRLALCPTPIGNLGDITLRVLEELRSADLILAEDTRRTRVLLRHHGIRRPVLSYHDHNEARREAEVLARLRAGGRVALVSDAGTPGLADPGFRLVRAAVAAGLPVTALPGPSALLPALVLSALPSHRFAFHGFVPRSDGARERAIVQALGAALTAVWYESPHRLARTLRTMCDLGFGAHRAAVARELTKVHEEVCRGSVAELAGRFTEREPLGEIVLMVAPAERDEGGGAAEDEGEGALAEVRERLAGGEPLPRAVAAVAAAHRLDRRVLYRAAAGAPDRPPASRRPEP